MSAVTRQRYLPELSAISKQAGTNETVKQNLDITLTTNRLYFADVPNTYLQASSGPGYQLLSFYVNNTLVQSLYSTGFTSTYSIYGTGSFRGPVISVNNAGSSVGFYCQDDEDVQFSYYRNGQPSSTLLYSVYYGGSYLATALELHKPIRLQNLASNPPLSLAGTIYWNTATQTIRVFNGTAWVDLGTSSDDIGDTIETGNLRASIQRSQTLPVTGSGALSNTFTSVVIADEADADQSRGHSIFSKGEAPNLVLARYSNTLLEPGSSPMGSSVGRILFVGSDNNTYSDFIRISGVKYGSANSVCFGNLEIGVRNGNGTYTTPFVFNSSGHFRVSGTIPPVSTPDSNTVTIGAGTCWIGNKLRVEGQVGYIEAANRADYNGVALNVHAASGKFAQVRFSLDNLSNQRGALEIDTTGYLAVIGGWNSNDYIRFRVGSGLPEPARLYADRFVLGQDTQTALVLRPMAQLPSVPESGMLVNHNNQLKFYDGTSWITIAS